MDNGSYGDGDAMLMGKKLQIEDPSIMIVLEAYTEAHGLRL